METKEQLLQSIRNWVKIDNEIRSLNSEVKSRKKEQKTISQSLMNVMKTNNIDEFELNDGKITYNKKNVKKPITKKALVSILSKYYDGNLQKAIELNSFILDNREEVEKETISRVIR